jgi:glycosyltransferase involved in cell wall biosynthesis
VTQQPKVCHIITRLDAGGAAENTLHTAIGLRRRSYEVSLVYGRTVAPAEALMRQAEEKGVRLVSLPCLVREISPWQDLRAFLAISRHLRSFKPDIVHTHSSKAGFLGRWAAWFARVPYIVHTPHGHIFYGYYGRGQSAFFRTIEKVTAWITDRLVTLTDLETEQHLECGIGRRDQFVTIHSGVDIDRFAGNAPGREAAREQLEIPCDAFCIGSAGRLVDIKNFSLLIEALGILQRHEPGRYCLAILGEGPLRESLVSQAESHGVGKSVRLPGWADSMETIYPAFDVFALSSKNEGMGRVLVEAMAAGVPVVATSVGGVPELLGGGEYGMLVPSGNATAMAVAIEKLAGSNKLRATLIEKGRQRANAYSLEEMVERVYREVAQGATHSSMK